ncbi:MAG: amidohydrolase family protein [Candidatus Heimdallarchaeota archaeon]
MSDILIRDGLVITMNDRREIIESGSVLIQGNKITAVGKTDEVISISHGDKVLDAKGKIVMPGLFCAHTHLYAEMLRGAPLQIDPPTDFIQNLQRIWWPLDEALTVEAAYASTLAGCSELIRTGTTTFADTYSGPESIEGSLDAISKAVNESGMRGIITFEVTERHSPEEGAKGLEENRQFIEKVNKINDSRVRGMYAVHASFTVSNDLLKRTRALADKQHAIITIHTSEGLGDLYHNLNTYGKRTVERLRDTGILGEDVVLAHCVHVNNDELRLIKQTGAKVAHNPQSNMLNAVGISPVAKMLEMGITVGLGNDGFVFDGFEAIRAAFLLQKLLHRDPRKITPLEALEMATIGAATCYGMQGEVGSLEVGKKADIIVINPFKPTPLNAKTVLGYLVYACSGQDVESTIVNGQILMEQKELTTFNLELVNNISQDAAQDCWTRLGIL